MRGDSSQAGHRTKRRPAFVIGFPARRQQGHGDEPVGRQGVFEHFPVALFENVQRLHDVRKQDQIRQRKQPGFARKVLEGKCLNIER